MASKAPPVPPDQQSGKIRGAHSPADASAEVKRDPAGGNRGLNLKEQGRYGGTHQNLTHQGRQQDR
jgi:hypothetical protein